MKSVAVSTDWNIKNGADIRQLKKSDRLFTHSSSSAAESQAGSRFGGAASSLFFCAGLK